MLRRTFIGTVIGTFVTGAWSGRAWVATEPPAAVLVSKGQRIVELTKGLIIKESDLLKWRITAVVNDGQKDYELATPPLFRVEQRETDITLWAGDVAVTCTLVGKGMRLYNHNGIFLRESMFSGGPVHTISGDKLCLSWHLDFSTTLGDK